MKNKLVKLFTPLIISFLSLTGCTDQKKEEKPAEPKYTVASAVDAVADLFSQILTEPLSANHDEHGDYIAINFGDSIDIDTMKAITVTYLIPEDFTASMEAWEEDAFSDGTPVEFIDYTCEKVGLEYATYSVSENLFFQVVGFEVEEASK